MRTTDTITTKYGSYVSLVILINELNCGGIMLENFFLTIFFKDFGCVFPKSLSRQYFRTGWFDWHKTNRKWIGWILGQLCELNHWPHPWPWPWIFQGKKFSNSCVLVIVRLIDVKCKIGKSVGYWADYVILSFDHTHNLGLGFSRSKFEIAFSQEWEGQLTWNERNVCIQGWI